MTYTFVALILLMILDIYILSQLNKHEIAIVELLKRHPDLLFEEEEDE